MARSEVIAAALALVSACSVPDDLLEDRACPCFSGWICDPATNRCVRDSTLAEDGGRLPDAATGRDGGRDDAATPTDAGPPAPPPSVDQTCWLRADACDWDGDFHLIVGDPAVIADAAVRGNVTFSPDGCSLYAVGGGVATVATRPSPGAPFGPSAPVEGLEGMNVGRASVAPDRRELYFGRSVPGMPVGTWRASRASPGAPWGALEAVPNLSRSEADDFDGALAPHGLRFYWSPSTGGDQDIWVAERGTLDVPFAPGAPLAGFTGAGKQVEPTVSADGRVLLLIVGSDLSYATREHWQASWNPPLTVPGPTLEASDESESALSPDGCEVLVMVDGVMTYLLHEAR